MTEKSEAVETDENISVHMLDEHPINESLEKLEELLNQLENPNLQDEEENNLIREIQESRLVIWGQQALIEIQNYTGELHQNYDIQKISIEDLVNDAKKYELFEYFLGRYFFLFNYFYHNYNARYTQFKDPELKIPEIAQKLLSKAPKFFSKKEAEDRVFHMLQNEVCQQLEIYYTMLLKYTKHTGEIDVDCDEAVLIEKMYQKIKEKDKKFQEHSAQKKNTWWRKLFVKLTTGD